MVACSYLFPIAAAAATLLSGAPVAQTALPVPASHLMTEGTTSTNVPFGRSTPTRVQYVYDGMLFASPVTITAVQFRIDGGATAAGKQVDCELRMSTMPGGLVSIQPGFAANRGVDETVVVPRQILTLPAHTNPSTPSAFLASIPLTTAFVYDPALGPLVLEIVVHGQPPGAYSLDATFVCTSPMVPIGPVSCPQSSGLPLLVESATTQVIWGRPWIARVLDAAPGALVVLAFGSQESGTWAGLTLPQDLGLLGASGCYLSIDAAVTVFDVAAADGSVAFPLAIPNTPLVLGEWLRYQAATFDAAANALGLVTSRAQKVQVCGWEPVARVWSNGISAAFGTREIGLAAVVQLIVQ